VHSQVKIFFMSITSVFRIDEIDHSIPQSGFEFADYEIIKSYCDDTTYLTGILILLFSYIYKFKII
jgi:hypothetical protein